jgi:HSP20 family protein
MLPSKFNQPSVSLSDNFDNWVDQFFGRNLFDTDFFYPRKNSLASTNVEETENDYKIRVQVPGFAKEDIKIEFEEGILSIMGKVEDSQEENNDNYCRKEYKQSSFSRSFAVPEDADTETIDATTQDGILTIQLNKKSLPASERKSIEIK